MTPDEKTLYLDVMQELYEDVASVGKESSFPLYSNWAICYILSSWKMHTCESVPAVGWFSAWWCEGRGKADPDHLESFLQIHLFLLSRLLDLSYSCPTLQAHSCQIFSMSVESTVYPVVQAPKLSVILFSSPFVIPYPPANQGASTLNSVFKRAPEYNHVSTSSALTILVSAASSLTRSAGIPQDSCPTTFPCVLRVSS